MSMLFLRACSVYCFPCCRFPWGFQVTGCLSFCFPGDVGWASALPFFFYASPAPLACRGRRVYAPCVRVLPLRWCLLGLKVRSPWCPSLTLEWVCFWPAVSQAFVGCEGSLGCPSWFVTALGSWTRTLAVGWSRYLLFSWILPWVLPSRFQCWLLAWGGWGLSLVVLPP